jgi:hypothetical protein
MSDEDAREIAREILGDPEASRLLRGESAEELLRSAHELGAVIQRLRAKQAPPVDFDSGPRELAPLPENPVRAHDEGVIDLVKQYKRRGGGTVGRSRSAV